MTLSDEYPSVVHIREHGQTYPELRRGVANIHLRALCNARQALTDHAARIDALETKIGRKRRLSTMEQLSVHLLRFALDELAGAARNEIARIAERGCGATWPEEQRRQREREAEEMTRRLYRSGALRR